MRSDFQLIFFQMAKLGPIVFEGLLCHHYKLASDFFSEVGDSYIDEVVQRSIDRILTQPVRAFRYVGRCVRRTLARSSGVRTAARKR